MAVLKVNKDQWDAISVEEQAAIISVLQKAGSLPPGDIIVR